MGKFFPINFIFFSQFHHYNFFIGRMGFLWLIKLIRLYQGNSHDLILNLGQVRSWVMKFFFLLISSFVFIFVLVLFYRSTELYLNQLSQTDHIESTSTQFNFNFRLCNELDQKITWLVHKTMFNNNIKYFFITFYIYIYISYLQRGTSM
jgi:hypothetical protein